MRVPKSSSKIEFYPSCALDCQSLPAVTWTLPASRFCSCSSIPSCDDEWGQVGFQQPSVIDQLHVPVLAMQLLLPMKYALLGCFLELTILLLHEKALSPKSPKSGLRLS